MENLTYEQLIGTVVVLMVLIGAYNVLMTAVRNRRQTKQLHDKPFVELKNRFDKLEKDYQTLSDRVEDLELGSKDLHAGLMTICEGVQALLNHSLADGNEEEMRGATISINKWLRSR